MVKQIEENWYTSFPMYPHTIVYCITSVIVFNHESSLDCLIKSMVSFNKSAYALFFILIDPTYMNLYLGRSIEPQGVEYVGMRRAS